MSLKSAEAIAVNAVGGNRKVIFVEMQWLKILWKR